MCPISPLNTPYFGPIFLQIGGPIKRENPNGMGVNSFSLADPKEEKVLENEEEADELRRVHDLLHLRLLRDLRDGLGGRQDHRQQQQQDAETDRALPIRHAFVLSSVARWQNWIPSFPWNVPGWRAWGRNPRKGKDQIL